MIKISVDATPFVRTNVDGVTRYSQELLKVLYTNPSVELTFVGFWNDDFSYIQKNFPKATIRKLFAHRRAWSLIFKTFPWAARVYKSNKLMIYTNFVQFPFFSKKSVVVVHDLAFIDQADSLSPRNLKYLRKLVPMSLDHAERVIAVSDYTRERISDELTIPFDKINTVSNAIDFDRFSNVAITNRKTSLELPGKYILTLGTVEPRKNIVGSLKSYHSLPDKLKQTYPLVIAGGAGWKNHEVHDLIEEFRLTGDPIIETGYVQDDDIPSIYAKASLLLFPSFYEGFGLPILEAQAAETPVITSDREPMKSVAGPNAALFVDPEKPESIAKAIQDLISNPSATTIITAKGVANAKKYSWSKSAQALLRVLEEIS